MGEPGYCLRVTNSSRSLSSVDESSSCVRRLNLYRHPAPTRTRSVPHGTPSCLSKSRRFVCCRCGGCSCHPRALSGSRARGLTWRLRCRLKTTDRIFVESNHQIPSLKSQRNSNGQISNVPQLRSGLEFGSCRLFESCDLRFGASPFGNRPAFSDASPLPAVATCDSCRKLARGTPIGTDQGCGFFAGAAMGGAGDNRSRML